MSNREKKKKTVSDSVNLGLDTAAVKEKKNPIVQESGRDSRWWCWWCLFTMYQRVLDTRRCVRALYPDLRVHTSG